MTSKPDSTVPKEWIEIADRDLAFGKTSLKNNPRFLTQICFYFQQAAEKYLKAYIVAKKLPFKKVHSLPVLVNICRKKDASFSQLEHQAKFLTEFYFEERYPEFEAPSKITYGIAQKAEAATEKIAKFVKSKLP